MNYRRQPRSAFAKDVPMQTVSAGISLEKTLDCLDASVGQEERNSFMVKFELLQDAGVLLVEPKSTLSADDFREISRVIDPYIHEKGKLTGYLSKRHPFPGGTALVRSSST